MPVSSVRLRVVSSSLIARRSRPLRCPAGTAQRPFGVAHHGGGVSHSVFGDPCELAGDAAHRGLRLVALLLAA
jgi:hypothetical protein